MMISYSRTFHGGKRMSVSYNKLWKLLIDKDMNKVTLRDRAGIGPSTLAKLTKNQRVSMEVLEKICSELDCNFGDIVDYIKK